MEELLHYFPLVLYVLAAILLIVLIILGIKLINTINKTNIILEDAYNKTKSLNGLFNIIDSVTDTLSTVSDTLVASITNIVGKVFRRGKKKEKENDENE
mgnify:CR=1 FL=1